MLKPLFDKPRDISTGNRYTKKQNRCSWTSCKTTQCLSWTLEPIRQPIEPSSRSSRPNRWSGNFVGLKTSAHHRIAEGQRVGLTVAFPISSVYISRLISGSRFPSQHFSPSFPRLLHRTKKDNPRLISHTPGILVKNSLPGTSFPFPPTTRCAHCG